MIPLSGAQLHSRRISSLFSLRFSYCPSPHPFVPLIPTHPASQILSSLIPQTLYHQSAHCRQLHSLSLSRSAHLDSRRTCNSYCDNRLPTTSLAYLRLRASPPGREGQRQRRNLRTMKAYNKRKSGMWTGMGTAEGCRRKQMRENEGRLCTRGRARAAGGRGAPGESRVNGGRARCSRRSRRRCARRRVRSRSTTGSASGTGRRPRGACCARATAASGAELDLEFRLRGRGAHGRQRETATKVGRECGARVGVLRLPRWKGRVSCCSDLAAAAKRQRLGRTWLNSAQRGQSFRDVFM